MLSIPQSKRPRQPPRPPTVADSPPDDGTDLMTILPNYLIEEILSRLPIDDAVRTSTLAKSWYNRWAKCPELQLQFFADDPPVAVDSVLSGYKCSISKFELHVMRESMGNSDGWLYTLATKGVRSLKLYFVPIHFWDIAVVPPSLFSCSELTSLELQFWEIPHVPSSFQGFSNLTELQLYEVRFPKNGVSILEALINMAPLLSDLGIIFPDIQANDDGHYDEWVIRAPKLKIIDIKLGEDYGWHIDHLPLLEEAYVDLEGPQLARMLSGMTRVKKLYIDFTGNTVLEKLPSYFMELKDLSFRTVFTSSPRILAIFCILRNALNLEYLHITVLHEGDERDEVDIDFLNAQWIAGLFSKLKYFKLSAIMGQSNEMQFIEFVLSKAAKLQNIEVSVHDDSSKSMEVVSSELSNYRKAFPQTEVIINQFTGYYIDETNDEEIQINDYQ
ncbi:hypothetical protein ACP70R_029149 [Stipagrostis hirtigluma subsp. patula]